MDVGRRSLMKGIVAGSTLLALGAPRWTRADPSERANRYALLLGSGPSDDGFERGVRAALEEGGHRPVDLLELSDDVLRCPERVLERMHRSAPARWLVSLDDAGAAVFQEQVRSVDALLLSRASHVCAGGSSPSLRHLCVSASPPWSMGGLLAARLAPLRAGFVIRETILDSPSSANARILRTGEEADVATSDWAELVGHAVAGAALELGHPAAHEAVYEHRGRSGPDLGPGRFTTFVVDL